MKLKREIDINGKCIEIYDDVFAADKRFQLYNFAVKSYYVVERSGSDVPERLSLHKTLKSEFSLKDILSFKFFENNEIINYIKKNNLRIDRCYTNLCSASDIYQYHVDTQTLRCPSGLYYINIEWDPTWEGETHFSDDSMQDILYSSAFIPGRFVVFDGTIPHKSSQPSTNAKYYRFVFVIKFAVTRSPNWADSITIEDFIYQKNCKLTKKEQICLNYLKVKTGDTPHSGTTFYEHLANTFYILKSLKQPERVCLAGMFHAIFGTEYFNFDKTIFKEEISKLIGKEAIHLVEQFSLPNRNNLIIQNLNNNNLQTQLDLLYILYANSIEQVYRIHIEQNFFTTVKNKIELIENMLKAQKK